MAKISPAELDKLFLTHLHLDHVGDFHVLFDGMGWARNTPLHVWGPSGYTKEMGTAHFCDLMHQAALWHIESKRGLVPSTGAEIISARAASSASARWSITPRPTQSMGR